ncbi:MULTISPECIES: extracellular solute-binding protein [unclassified Enterococcus]|uniref:ABC transporter substrate-binding protein n=1 Tax=unclassified Enterococcus TaxID=2608891 RepID=UPI0015522B2F|nr:MULTISPECIES: extracellular solute-binding protein [unclassified Enterococcus]MBS7578051.1 extracellular solute-binding protein [Enterococcus sp. MMGLQ5-2]MBS7585259.1 extracellular solute-binding protein [Enterococcus sp. MMGLQ5-1]NPD13116.1 extracellular solute-binding protein [Enterococcus sp. MMGLQ5-1]NPD37882.1 extracellular solute-binding protein [Enterococcus sp. MMGLQ5-2]
MKFMKRMVLAATAVASISLLAACGSSGGSSSKTEIEFFSQKPEMLSTIKAIAKEFEKENKDITVKVVSVPDPGNVLKTRISSKDAPDIMNVFPQNADFQEWANAGEFVDMTGKSYMSNIKEGVAEQYAINDKVYSAPLNSNAWGFFYNADALEKLGLEAPTTWAEFEQLVKAIKAKGETPFALSLAQGDAWSLNGFGQLAWAEAAGGFDGAQAILRDSAKGSISATSTEFKAVTSQLDILRNNGQNNANGATYNDAITAFATGKALILPQGIWALPAIQQQNPDFEIRSFAYPGQTADDAMSVGAADMALSISSKSKNIEASEKFIEYFSSAKVFQKYYDVDGSPTSVVGVDTEDKFPETEGITRLTFTDKQFVWLQSKWDSEADFHTLTADYVRDGNAADMADKLNVFFDSMK